MRQYAVFWRANSFFERAKARTEGFKKTFRPNGSFRGFEE
jgi:hypothetical protein